MHRKVIATAALALIAVLMIPLDAPAQVLPTGFAFERIVKDPFHGQPVGFAFLPDKRPILIMLNNGIVRVAPVVDRASYPVSSDSIYTIADVLPGSERGLLGVAADPGWPASPYLYFYFTSTTGHNRLIRLTAAGDLSDSSSTNLSLSDRHEVVVITDSVDSHNGGTVRFGPDGYLYLSVGDDKKRCTAQEIHSLNGSILRIDVNALPPGPGGPPVPADITPPSNPFAGLGGNAGLKFAYGLRNPFRFTVDAPTNDLYVGDVGLDWWEEVNRIDYSTNDGVNFGWPWIEGPDSFQTCDTAAVGMLPPIYAYPHPPAFPASIIGGPLYRSTFNSGLFFPSEYEGDYFFIEPNMLEMRRITDDGSGWDLADSVAGQPSSQAWASLGAYATDFQLGPDGALYFMIFSTAGLPRGIHRIVSDHSVSVGPEEFSPVFAGRAQPNPFPGGSGTTIHFAIPGGDAAPVRIFDVSGRLIRTLDSDSGTNRAVFWDGRTDRGVSADAGVYFYQVEPKSGSKTGGKLILLR